MENIYQTTRLTIRNFADDDWPRLQSFGGQPQVARMMASLKSPWPEADVKIWMKRGPYCGKLGFGGGIYLEEVLIGFVGIGGNPVNCAYAVDPDYWGNGYATEALRGLLMHCFTHLGLEVVEADHFTDNGVSGKVLCKLGFIRMGERIGDSLAREKPETVVYYQLTADQFLQTL